jgi:2-dehydro-3-deoxyphosphooctonate aldolase (KDO 8-P synthase)
MESLNNFFIMSGPNVIESEEHTMSMARKLKDIYSKYDIHYFFKTSFDKANRSSLNSYRGVGFEEGLRILKRVKDELNIPIITDIHESWQAKPVSEVADIIQIPAFLCRQTDLLKAAAETGKIIQVKKGQFCSAEQMHKCKEKIIEFGNPNVILCERGNSFGYQDLVVDPRNLIWLKSDTNLVSMDITHCLQTPSQKSADGTVKCGGYRDLIPYMGKMAICLGVNGIFMEVHDNPDEALCDGPTQWPLDKLEWLLDFLDISKNIDKSIDIAIPCRLKSTRLENKPLIKINNEYIINKTIHQVQKSKHNININVMTDSTQISDILPHNVNCILNCKEYSNGIYRISDNLTNIKSNYLLIIHGDQPYLNYKNIDIMLEYFFNNKLNDNEILMGYTEINEDSSNDSSIAKIVTNTDNYLMYISRSKIPHNFTNSQKILYKKGVSLLIIPKNKILDYKNIEMSNLQIAEDNEWIKFIDTLDCKIKCIELFDVEQDLNNKQDYEYLLKKYNEY